jgi:ribonucleoside-diphosphate reductase subunit M1
VQYLLKDLVERGIWTPEVRNQIIADRGSVQGSSSPLTITLILIFTFIHVLILIHILALILALIPPLLPPSLPHLPSGVSAIPQDVKDLYKTVWEIKQKAIIDQAADRGTTLSHPISSLTPTRPYTVATGCRG